MIQFPEQQIHQCLNTIPVEVTPLAPGWQSSQDGDDGIFSAGMCFSMVCVAIASFSICFVPLGKTSNSEALAPLSLPLIYPYYFFFFSFIYFIFFLFYKSCFLEDVTDISLDHEFKLLILSNLSDFLCVPMTSNTHMRYVPYLAQFKNYLQITFINSAGD